jgi:hypothetical protein
VAQGGPHLDYPHRRSELKKIHTRTMDMEIAGHEFFSQDGKQILYDLQTPKSQVFWLASYDIKSGKLTKYGLTKTRMVVHLASRRTVNRSSATAAVRTASQRRQRPVALSLSS